MTYLLLFPWRVDCSIFLMKNNVLIVSDWSSGRNGFDHPLKYRRRPLYSMHSLSAMWAFDMKHFIPNMAIMGVDKANNRRFSAADCGSNNFPAIVPPANGISLWPIAEGFSLDDLSQQISILLPTRRWRPRRQRITQTPHHLPGIILFFLWKDKKMVHILIVFTFPISISIPPFVPVDSKTLDVPDDIYTVVSDCSYYLISPQKKKACENYHFSSSLDVAAETQIRL